MGDLAALILGFLGGAGIALAILAVRQLALRARAPRIFFSNLRVTETHPRTRFSVDVRNESSRPSDEGRLHGARVWLEVFDETGVAKIEGGGWCRWAGGDTEAADLSSTGLPYTIVVTLGAIPGYTPGTHCYCVLKVSGWWGRGAYLSEEHYVRVDLDQGKAVNAAFVPKRAYNRAIARRASP
ncbi:MAG: hypothetical protein ACTSXZ_10200 [Alphaproteobacteria bacterium]